MILQCLMGNYFIEHYNRLVNFNSSIIMELLKMVHGNTVIRIQYQKVTEQSNIIDIQPC